MTFTLLSLDDLNEHSIHPCSVKLDKNKNNSLYNEQIEEMEFTAQLFLS